MFKQRIAATACLVAMLCGCGKTTFPVPWRPAAKALPPTPASVIAQPQLAPLKPVVEEPRPLAELPDEVRMKLESLGARITTRPGGYNIDIRRKPGFTDKDIDLIVQCSDVTDVTLENVAITDEGLKKLESLPRLSRLILNGSPISDAGLQTLAGLPLADSLISIGLRGTKVTDEGMAVIEKFSHLQRLDVSDTAVTDAGLASLQGLPLEMLNVAGTKISAAGVKPLQEKLPELVVKR
jgi:hypothetical protein